MGGTPWYFIPICICLIGVGLLIWQVASVKAPFARRALWSQLNCTIGEVRIGEFPLGCPTATTTTSKNCSFCVAAVRCESSNSSVVELLTATSLESLVAGVQAPMCVGGFNASVLVLRNPQAVANQTLSASYACRPILSEESLTEDEQCCPQCSVFDSPAQLRSLRTTKPDIALGASLLGVGAGLFLLGAAIIHGPDCYENIQAEQRRAAEQRRVPDLPLDLDFFREPVRVVERRVRAVAPDPTPRVARRKHRRRKRRAQADDSPPAGVRVVCGGCQAPLAADALGCRSCAIVSQERLQQNAFSFQPGGDDEALCAVCLEDLEPGVSVVALPCAHTYHVECIGGWLATKNNCPQCLATVIH
jgi:hypothetical protein